MFYDVVHTILKDYREAKRFFWEKPSKLKYLILLFSIFINDRINFNKTTNGTQTTSCFDPTARRIGYTVTYSLISVVSVIANLLIAIIFYKTKTLRKSINFFIVNMAISDILLPIFLITPYLTSLYTEDPWLISGPVGVVLCKLVMFLPHVSVSVSTESLVLIAMDRFIAVVFPIRSPLISSRLCPFVILVTWIVAMAVSYISFHISWQWNLLSIRMAWCVSESGLNLLAIAYR